MQSASGFQMEADSTLKLGPFKKSSFTKGLTADINELGKQKYKQETHCQKTRD